MLLSLLPALVALAFAEVVVKPNGMFNVIMSSDSCGITEKSTELIEESKEDPNVEIINLVSDDQLQDFNTCGRYNEVIAPRISGGDTYSPYEYPFIAAVLSKGVPNCGGSILTRYHVLTAAHCVEEYMKPFSVLVGAYDLSRPSINIPAKNAVQHPSFDSTTFAYDIAVLTLSAPVAFSKTIGPVCLPVSDLDSGSEVKILGWGAEESKGPMTSKPKEMVTQTITSATCSRQWGTCVSPTKPKQICTYSETATPCQGDSGGPVVWLDPATNSYTLVGIVSFGPACTEEKAAVNTKVLSFLSWIRTQMNG